MGLSTLKEILYLFVIVCMMYFIVYVHDTLGDGMHADKRIN